MSFLRYDLLIDSISSTKEVKDLDKLISKKELIDVGYSAYSASKIIREAKELLVKEGFIYYKNRRVGKVPTTTVEKILGISL